MDDVGLQRSGRGAREGDGPCGGCIMMGEHVHIPERQGENGAPGASTRRPSDGRGGGGRGRRASAGTWRQATTAGDHAATGGGGGDAGGGGGGAGVMENLGHGSVTLVALDHRGQPEGAQGPGGREGRGDSSSPRTFTVMLQTRPERHVEWTEETVDNEFLGRLSSKSTLSEEK